MARTQAEKYASALPASEYTPFLDPRSHRIKLADLARPEVQDTLRRIWTEPDSLAEQIDHHRKKVLRLLPSNANHSQAPDTPGRGLQGADFWACDSMRHPAIPAPAQHSQKNSQQPKQPPMQESAKNLTLTGLYNVLEALKQGRSLTPKEKQIHTQGLVGVLKDLHDDLDAAVLPAYGWTDKPAPHSGHPGSPGACAARG